MPAQPPPPARSRAVSLLVLALAGTATGALQAADHPRLLLAPTDLPRLRHLCGVGSAVETDPGWGKFGSAAADFQLLRRHFSGYLGEEPLPGELLAAAFLHLVDPNDTADVNRLGLLNGILQRNASGADPLDAVLVLDWCWGALEAGARAEALLVLRRAAEPLLPTDSPLDPHRFRARLAGLALALAIDETDDPSPSWRTLREKLLAAARTYFVKTLPTFVEWRTLSPTGSASAAQEESLTALAIELSGRVTGRDPWPEYQASVGRWLEHYVFETFDSPLLPHGFLRADGAAAPLTPVPVWDELLPLTAHLLANRTRNPAAALLAERVEAAWRASPAEAGPALWRWVPLICDTAGVPRCNPARLPTARNFGGGVVFRGGSGANLTAVWINAGQPYLRRRQHFDAGHFLIYRAGELAARGGDDVLFEATAAKRGEQRLGTERSAFDFEQFDIATIAHNCLVQWDAARAATWNKQRFLPIGGQRCLDTDCTNFGSTLAAQGRETARQRAYGEQDGLAYLALDLTPAYESRMFSAYTREYIFVGDGALLVIDRLRLPRKGTATWVLNVPGRPTVDGADLADKVRVTGSTNEGGVWRYDTAEWLRWTDGAGALWCRALLPEPHGLRIVGGPAVRQVIKAGRFAGRNYVGGGPESFERLIIPAERYKAHNAWYRLGEPTLLGAELGKEPHWGRVELEPEQADSTLTFMVLLLTAAADVTQPPTASIESSDGSYLIRFARHDEEALLRLPAEMDLGGTVERRAPQRTTWTLPTGITPDGPLPLQ